MAVLYQLDLVCVLFLQLLIFSNLTNAHEEMECMNLNSTEKNFTIDCDSLVTSSLCDSLTLSQIAGNLTHATHVYIGIVIPQLQLIGKVEFKHHESLTITGKSTVISCSEEDSGLVFVNVTKVTIMNVTLTNCGSRHDSAYYYVVCLLHCTDITFSGVSATNNSATAVSILDHQGGTVQFSDCNFTNNSIKDDTI